VVVGAFMPPR